MIQCVLVHVGRYVAILGSECCCILILCNFHQALVSGVIFVFSSLHVVRLFWAASKFLPKVNKLKLIRISMRCIQVHKVNYDMKIV